MSEDLEALRQLKFMRSRIPALDALEIFVPDGSSPDPEWLELQARSGQSRWYPVEGGHRVLIPYEGGPYDTHRFSLAKGAWNHEHCSRCGGTIEPMTLCWVTRPGGDYVLLDEKCYEEVFGPEPAA